MTRVFYRGDNTVQYLLYVNVREILILHNILLGGSNDLFLARYNFFVALNKTKKKERKAIRFRSMNKKHLIFEEVWYI